MNHAAPPHHPPQRNVPPSGKRPRLKRGRRPGPPPNQYPQPSAQPPQPGYYGAPGYPPQQPPAAQHGQPGARPPRRRGRRGRAIAPGCILGCMGVIGIVVLGFLITSWLVYDHYSHKLEDKVAALEKLADYNSFETTIIYDRHGGELYEVFDEGRRTRIDFAQIPQDLINATISVEDDTFYENKGIDIPSILRAGKQYVQHGYVVSGGSTITQQLIRNVLFDYEYRTEQSLNRKIEEALLAVILTQRMSKDDILELYLNEIYYGNLAYGIEAAAQTYFGKPAAQLTLAESALLAGLPQAPADLDPLNPDPAIQQRVNERRRYVLDRMVNEGYITQDQSDAAYAESLTYASVDIRLDRAPHFVVYAQDELENLLISELGLSQADIRKMIAGGGLRVYTTVDMDYQRLAEQVARQQVAALAVPKHLTNAAVVVLRPDTGEILAMVGSVNYEDEAIDGQVNVTLAMRQPGSSIKPFNYVAALEEGWTAATLIWDTETHIGPPGQQYTPLNYDGSYHGPVRLREALANSYNVPAVQTLRFVGVDYLLWMMHRVGVASLSNDPSYYGLSLTLGGGEVTPLELTTAYAVLANHGIYTPNTSIMCVTNADGDILYEYERRCPNGTQLTDHSRSVNANARQVIDPRIAFVISSILSDNDTRSYAMGANSPLYTPGLPTSVKTGTTNDFKDNWTVGYTRNIAIGVWAGNTDNTAMQGVSGIEGAAPIWHDIMTGIYGNPALLDLLGMRPADDEHLQPPGGVYARQICTISRTALQDPATGCAPGINEWFLDSPAAVPDSSGNLQYPAATPPPQPGTTGPQPVEVEPGLIRVAVYPVQPDLANAIAASDGSGHTVPPRYCQVPIEVATMIPGVQEQLFLAPPQDPDDAFYARLWAQAHGVAIVPQFACNEQMLQAQPPGVAGGGGSVPGIVANIVSPAPGAVVPGSQQIDIVGTAAFPADQAAFYKVEIQGGPFPSFVTLGDVNNWKNRSGVTNGVLESIMPGALPPGSYVIQLVIVAPDGNFVQPPYQVPFTVG